MGRRIREDEQPLDRLADLRLRRRHRGIREPVIRQPHEHVLEKRDVLTRSLRIRRRTLLYFLESSPDIFGPGRRGAGQRSDRALQRGSISTLGGEPRVIEADDKISAALGQRLQRALRVGAALGGAQPLLI